ncbi:hydrogenase maturation nickel metallochaperone HypA [Salidesulfovibrio onnuriiensis]|uniref:hydrogenase maturation nickel metallochaperone HypA/HybF n=1 Tax=Salidesulfovibrio onnuriiensis TaxID=2583823 RepID=UPI0032B71CF3
MSIAQSILSILEDEMTKRDIAKLKRVVIKNGALAGVVSDALHFAWTALTPDTRFDGTILELEEIPLKVKCGECGEEFHPDDTKYMPCPKCEAMLGHEVLEGKELYIDFVEPADEEDPAE